MSAEILLNDGIQRKEKFVREAQVNKEISDVIITTLLLAENLDINIIDELEKGIEKRKNRNY
ncbi:MAG: hypothetical protein ACOYT4_04685 [Nanoarchaeota archaeon]